MARKRIPKETKWRISRLGCLKVAGRMQSRRWRSITNRQDSRFGRLKCARKGANQGWRSIKWHLGLYLWAAAATADFHQVPLAEGRWDVYTDQQSCRLEQAIPHLGRVHFLQEAGQPLRLQLVLENEAQVIEAGVQVQPAPWHHGETPGRRLPVDGIESRGRLGQRLWVEGIRAERMLTALFNGSFPEFYYRRPWEDEGGWEARVSISAVRLWEVYDRFQACRRRLPSFGIRDFRNLHFSFSPFQALISRELRTVLSQIATLLKSQSQGQVVVSDVLSSLEDKQGALWFEKRFRAVRQFLRQEGLKPSQVVTASEAQAAAGPKIPLKLFGPESLRLYHYDSDQKSWSPLQRNRLNLLAQYCLEHFSGVLVINGHSDDARWRSEQVNLNLARQWAEKVRDFLIRQGISSERLEMRVWGGEKPVASNRSRAGRAKNRRVEIEFVPIPVLSASR
ncbi:OmpA family protein [Methylohalobius crimeensis]|uniref:OmpA family protein n=1 Tax=Methylohalobius crimeensis TaxID=244365 RepID=UPI0003B58814|nr:OmpA family protein [Methylohalobius crimeensis]